MKWSQEAFCALKGHFFSLNPTHHLYLTNFEWNYIEIFAVENNILQKVWRVYRLVQYPIAVNKMPQQLTKVNKIFIFYFVCLVNEQFWFCSHLKFNSWSKIAFLYYSNSTIKPKLQHSNITVSLRSMWTKFVCESDPSSHTFKS